jgi:UDP-glucose 4-epimerase
VNEIARIIISEMGLNEVKVYYTGGTQGWPGDVPQVRYDTSKMEQLGWKPKYTSDEAIYKTVKEILNK